jgi:hypothetical protein
MKDIMGTERWVNEGTITTDTNRVLAALNHAMPGMNWVVDPNSGHFQATTSLTPQAAQRLRDELMREPLLSSLADLHTQGIGELISLEAAGNGNAQVRIHNQGIRQHGLEGLEDPAVISTLRSRTQVELPRQQNPNPQSSGLNTNDIERPPGIPSTPSVGRSLI